MDPGYRHMATWTMATMIHAHMQDLACIKDKITYAAVLRRHAYEARTFPLRNRFQMGDEVTVHGHGLGRLLAFNEDGTLFIQLHDGPPPRDFYPQGVFLRRQKDARKKRYVS